MRTRVKICGITRSEDARAAAVLGADAIGLVMHRDSPRAVEPGRAGLITQGLPPFVTVVGLFANAQADDVLAALKSVHIDLLQFHGEETPEFCAQFGRPYIKSVRMQPGVDLGAYANRYARARALLLDSYHAGLLGGTGTTFDWTRVPTELPMPIVLAGGLTPENVAGAIHRVHPYAVDVSSGVERSKGIKDAAKISDFIQSVNSASAT